jgi:hypothetical protein
MIDNSSSMADKQVMLTRSVSDLVGRFTNPPDFEPINDIHIGIISSSLGGHGSSGVCDQPDSRKTFSHNDDKGHLLARGPMDAAISVMGGKPFLDWNPTMGGYGDASAIGAPFAQMVTGVGEHGCGYEASLESIYRFLIDPDPYDTISIDKRVGGLGEAVLTGTDFTVLQQRKEFLRPDSLVAVVMMTDENDCSIVDGGQNFYVIAPASGTPPKGILTGGTSACQVNPNDPCCFSCLQHTRPEDPPPPGCVSSQDDPICARGPLLESEDPANLRCFHQKQRYGIDFLYPVKRYIDGFTSTEIVDRHGDAVKNPLYDDLQCVNHQGCAAERDKTYVFLAGIVGVPWQDIANDPNDLTKGYKTAKQINDENLWAKVLGNPHPSDQSAPVPPTDVHMIESVAPRAGLPLPDAEADADPIDGHEWDTSKDSPPNRDLQYACTFPLPTPRACTDSTDCDCADPSGGSVADTKNPLCQGALGYSTTQLRAKAYPGLRELEVLQGLNDQAVVASICPANVTDESRADFGYRPAVDALVGRMRSALRGRCLPRAFEVRADGTIPCVIVEAFDPPTGEDCNCDGRAGRRSVSEIDITPTLKESGSCVCEIRQLDGDAGTTCRTLANSQAIAAPGWCYVDPDQRRDAAECTVVADCPATDRRLIRYVGRDTPRNGSSLFLQCEESMVVPEAGEAICNR